MKLTSLTGIGGLSRLAVLLIFVAAGLKASALESDEINAAILDEGRFSIPVQWTNDATHPWYLYERTDGTSYLHSPNKETSASLISSISFSYTSSYPTQISFSIWAGYSYDNDGLQIIIDGETKSNIRRERWETYTSAIIPAGSHIVELKYSQYSYYTLANSSSYFAGIDNLKVLECQELENSALTPESLPLTFENDPENMWITEDGYIRSQGSSTEGYTTSIKTTFTIDKPSLFGYEVKRSSTDTYYTTYGAHFIIDGEVYWKNEATDWYKEGIVLYPGTHTIEYKAYRQPVYLRNIRLDQTWYDVNVTTPGELGLRLYQALGDKNLQDTELLEIRGSINAADWATIKQLTQIRAVDFTETNITEIPASAFSGRLSLSTVMLPQTLETIGDNAFQGTYFGTVTIPKSVKTIGNEAWKEGGLRFITFEEDSQLTTIGYGAFYNTILREFEMPNSVTTLSSSNYGDSGLFMYCYYLNNPIFSDNLSSIPRYACYGCTALTNIHLPASLKSIGQYAFKNTSALKSIELPGTLQSIGYEAFRGSGLNSIIIPSNVTSLGEYSFRNCTKLKEVELGSYSWDLNNQFNGCNAIEKIKVPCATPPTINYDPFGSITKSSVELIVPDFAMASYKIDSYWYQFTNIHSDDDVSTRDFWAIRGNLNLTPDFPMRGTPDVEMVHGSSLKIDAETAQSFNQFRYWNRESNPSKYLSNSNSVTANNLLTSFYIENKDTWYFFSPVVDVNMSDITFPNSDSWVIRYYDGARRAAQNASSGNWINVPADGVLHRGQGYILRANTTGYLYMPAASTAEHEKFFGANEVTMSLDDNLCETAANAGWNFVANPYPCYYDIYYIDMQAPITVWTGNTYRALSLNDGDRGTDTYVLRPMQPFFVQKASADLTTRMPLVGRQTTTTIDRTRAPQRVVPEENGQRQMLNLELFAADNEEADDYSRIVLNENASLEYETIRDASKFMSMNADVAQLYSLGTNNHPMAINERPYAAGSVGLGVYLPVSGNVYRIVAPRCDRQAWLYDADTGMQHDLTTGEYIFTASKQRFDNNRFTVRFASGAVGTDTLSAAGISVQGLNGAIAVSVPSEAEVAVYAADGSVVAQGTQCAGATEYATERGIYVVKVNGATYKVIVK